MAAFLFAADRGCTGCSTFTHKVMMTRNVQKRTAKRTKPAPRKKAAKKRVKKVAPPAAPIGRPSSYRPEFVDQARKLADLGARDVDLADFFDVSINTIHNWKTSHPEFLGALKVGKDQVDDRVERSLLQRALGYTFDSVKIIPQRDDGPLIVPIREHVPPDTTACIFWLKNRRRDAWRDRQDLEHTGKDGGPIETREMSELEVARRLAFILESARRKQEPKGTQ